MRYKIEEHDYQVVNQAECFSFKDGDKVKATVMFRREIQHSDLAETLLKRMVNDLQEVGEVQQVT